MNGLRGICTRLLAVSFAVLAISAGSQAATLDRWYKMGDDPAEGAAPGGSVNVTFDSVGAPGQGELVDLSAVNTPTYATISGRPDGGGGLGIQFNAAQMEYLHGFNLGFPEESFSAATHHTPTGGALDYQGISNRGLQFWVRPTSTAIQTLVMDTNQHGVRINANGRFSMRYAGSDYESTQAVTPNTWYHVEVVRPAGAANGSRMFINGVAVAAAPGGYNDDWADLTVGT
ncbi:MAG TPA: LamG-like jellyroll fold domain-containing protein, partial [Lacipirellulaceae bacterium]